MVAIMTPEGMAKTIGLSVQETIDRVHEYFRKITSDLGYDADPTGLTSPVIIWNRGKGFTHPTLDSRMIVNLMHHLGHAPKPTEESHGSAPVLYGRPTPLVSPTVINPTSVPMATTIDNSLFADIPFVD